MAKPETFKEWRVVGQPAGGGPAYDFIWSSDRNPCLGEPEVNARNFFELAEKAGWTHGPWLSERTVTRTDWKLVAGQCECFGGKTCPVHDGGQ